MRYHWGIRTHQLCNVKSILKTASTSRKTWLTFILKVFGPRELFTAFNIYIPHILDSRKEVRTNVKCGFKYLYKIVHVG